MRAKEDRMKYSDLTRDIKPYVINKAEDGRSAKVNLYGEIVESVPTNFWTGEKVDGLFIELEGFLKDIETLSDMDDVSFYINSVGGNVHAGISIYNKIRGMKAHTTTIVDGLAASAASIVAQAGDERKVSIGSQTMVHCASTLLLGYYNRDDLKDVTNLLKGVDNAIAELLADRTGRDNAEIMNMMSKTTWMTSEEAVKEGFADEVINKTEPTVDRVENSSTYIINGIPHNFSNMQVPAFTAVGTYRPVLNGSEPVNINNNFPKKEEGNMNLKELKATYPELVNQIQEEARAAAQTEMETAVKNAVDEAVKAERTRMQEIDSIANTVEQSLVVKAKYEEPIDAKELAFRAMQNAAAKGAEYMKDRTTEQTEAGINNITASPVSGSEEDTTEKDIRDGAALLNAAVH